MDKQTQDLNWRCLPKLTRTQMRLDYPGEDDSEWDRGYASALRQFFGNRNLKSNTEPKEMLMVSKSKVMERIKYLYSRPPHIAAHAADERASELLSFFGDKCLPDPTVLNAPSGGGGMSLKPPAYKLDVETDTPNTPNSGELKSDKDISILETSTTVEPKFEVGDKVRVLENAILADNRGKIATIVKQGQCCKGYGWVLDISKSVFLESELEPYTEPESRNLSQEIANCDKSKDNQLKDNMEKELNLLNILSDSHIGETFYSLIEGYVKFEGIEPHWKEYGMKPLRFAEGNFNPDGTYQTKSNASCCIWPSKELYEKYPLDPVKAWSIWASERKPKYEFSGCMYIYEDGATVGEFDLPELKFKSLEEAQQAAEAVRDTLMKIHEQNQK